MDPTRRRWWDGETWTAILTRPVAEPERSVALTPTMGDGTTLPYASDTSAPAVRDAEPRSADDEGGSARPSRVRVLQMLVACAAILATAAIVVTWRGDPAPPADVAPTATTIAETTTTAPSVTTTVPVDEPVVPAEPIEAPSYRDAFAACQVILDGSSIGEGGLDYQTFRDIEADTTGAITELRFEATDADGTTDAYLCRTLLDGDGDVMVGRLYLDLQHVLTAG